MELVNECKSETFIQGTLNPARRGPLGCEPPAVIHCLINGLVMSVTDLAYNLRFFDEDVQLSSSLLLSPTRLTDLLKPLNNNA